MEILGSSKWPWENGRLQENEKIPAAHLCKGDFLLQKRDVQPEEWFGRVGGGKVVKKKRLALWGQVN